MGVHNLLGIPRTRIEMSEDFVMKLWSLIAEKFKGCEDFYGIKIILNRKIGGASPSTYTITVRSPSSSKRIRK